MENKKSTGKTLAIIILVILLLGTVGYIAYDKLLNENDNETNIKNYQNDIKSLKNELETLKNEDLKTNVNPLSALVGKYAYSGNPKTENECGVFATLEIKSDGTGEYNGGVQCGSGEVAKGKLAMSADKIYLFNDNCKEAIVSGNECIYPNCTHIVIFDYKDGKLTIAVQNDEQQRVELTKQ
ncbi:MAG: hypothetical protein IKG40_04825 [Bacilli bacterium]|nr:hypothetical protein [Bacilli bacterium]